MSEWLGVGQVSFPTWTNFRRQQQQQHQQRQINSPHVIILLRYHYKGTRNYDENGWMVLQTVLEIVPCTYTDNNKNNNDDDETYNMKEEEREYPLMKLHPYMEEFLLLSCRTISKLLSNNNNNNNNDDDDENENVLQFNQTNNEEEEEEVIVECILPKQPQIEDDDEEEEEEENEMLYELHRDVFTIYSIHKLYNYHDTITNTTRDKQEEEDENVKLHVSLQFISCTNNNNNNDDDDDDDDEQYLNKEQMKICVQNALVGRIVSLHSVIALPIQSHGGGGGGGVGGCCDEEEKEEIVYFFKVNEIITKQSNDNDEKDNNNDYEDDKEEDEIVAYRLGKASTFSLTIQQQQQQQIQEPQQQTTTNHNEEVKEKEEEYSIQSIHKQTLVQRFTTIPKSCPGYENIIIQLYSLLTLQKYQGVPSGIVITGCAGVGKSTLASCLIQKVLLHHHNNNKHHPHNNNKNMIVCNVSARDILLNYASSSFSSSDMDVSSILDSILNKYINDNYANDDDFSVYQKEKEKGGSDENYNDAKKTLPFVQNNNTIIDGILVIDDLDVLANLNGEEEEEEDDGLDSERILTLHIISSLMDRLAGVGAGAGAGGNRSSIIGGGGGTPQQKQQRQVIMIGLSRCPPHQLPKRIVRIGKLEKHVEMNPPTQKQREKMLCVMLKDLPISSSSSSSSSSLSSNKIQRWSNVLAMRTAGCVASDLKRLCVDAFTRASARFYNYRSLEQDDGDMVASSVGGGGGDDGGVESEGMMVVDVTWEDLKLAALSCIPSQLAELDVSTVQITDDEEDDDESDDENVKENHHHDSGDKEVYSSMKKRKKRRRYDKCWKTFGGYKDAKDRIYRTVVMPWRKYAMEGGDDDDDELTSSSCLLATEMTMDSQSTLKLSPPSGVIFHGPPGVGKTFAVDCLAASLGLHVVKVRASDILDKWLGGSESAIRSLFARARSAAPCILFFDEIDALACNREDDGDGGSDVHSRVLSTLLNEMDGVSSNQVGRGGVLVVAATNRINAIDAALLRPGRLEEHILLDLPSIVDIKEIFEIHTARMPLGKDVDLIDLAEVLHELGGANGAVVEGICREACMITIRGLAKPFDDVDDLVVPMSSFEGAICRWKR